jgi:hypothetical protein
MVALNQTPLGPHFTGTRKPFSPRNGSSTNVTGRHVGLKSSRVLGFESSEIASASRSEN